MSSYAIAKIPDNLRQAARKVVVCLNNYFLKDVHGKILSHLVFFLLLLIFLAEQALSVKACLPIPLVGLFFSGLTDNT